MARFRRLAPATIVGFFTGLAVLLAFLLAPVPWRETLRERGFDLMLSAVAPWRAAMPEQRIAVVDIDAASLAEIGAWPWRRETLARLIDVINAARPASIGLDILLAGADTRSPAALARQLAAESGRGEIGELAAKLVDGDKALIEAIDKAPLALGWVLDPRGTAPMPDMPILTRDGGRLGELWRERAAAGPIADDRGGGKRRRHHVVAG